MSKIKAKNNVVTHVKEKQILIQEPISQMVVQAMNDLNIIVDEQSNLIQKLYERVRIVLRTVTDESVQMSEYKSYSVPLADDIASVTNLMRKDNDTLKDIISRLEI